MKKISSQARAVLNAREKRYMTKQHLIQMSPALTCIEVSMNIPGLPKIGHQWRRVFRAGVQRLHEKFEIVELKEQVDPAGYYALLFTGVEAKGAKRICCEIEMEEPWGRLLDVDCSGPNGKLSRRSLGLPDRACMLCGGSQEACIRQKKHSLEQVRMVATRLAGRLS